MFGFRKKQMEFPADENGDVLRLMQENGYDLSKPRVIEFCFAFPQRNQADQFAGIVDDKDLTVSISVYEERNMWQAIVSKHMLPNYAEITDLEKTLSIKAESVGGEADGWGSFQVGKKRETIMSQMLESLFRLLKYWKKSSPNETTAEQWLISEKLHEGFPLFLRRAAKLNYDDIASLYSKLIVITHHLSKVKPNGLPPEEYNYSLAEFDYYVMSYLKSQSQGLTVLVETFAGNRVYYCYAVDNFSLDVMKNDIETKYPGNNIEWTEKRDTDANFIRQYAKEWF